MNYDYDQYKKNGLFDKRRHSDGFIEVYFNSIWAASDIAEKILGRRHYYTLKDSYWNILHTDLISTRICDNTSRIYESEAASPFYECYGNNQKFGVAQKRYTPDHFRSIAGANFENIRQALVEIDFRNGGMYGRVDPREEETAQTFILCCQALYNETVDSSAFPNAKASLCERIDTEFNRRMAFLKSRIKKSFFGVLM